MKKVLALIAALMLMACAASLAEGPVDTLSYAVFPYLPDAGYYQELIEQRWAEAEPDIRLVRAKWDCYTDGTPEGIDVVMFDAVTLERLAAAGWIRPIDPQAVRNPDDLFPFALDGMTVDGALYGIPVFFCGNFLIYDRACEALAAAEHLPDLADLPEILVVNAQDPMNRPQYIIETVADATGVANPSVISGAEDVLALLDRLAIDAHERDDDDQVTAAYDAGIGRGYIGFSESMRLLERRAETSRIKAISFSARANLPRLYVDAAAITAGVSGQRYEKCLELLNIMAEADVLTALSVRNGTPQYLLMARRTPYRSLARRFPLYTQLEELAGDEQNVVILTP